MARNAVLAQEIDVRLSLSDWLTFLGWCSANLTPASPRLVVENIQCIGTQVNDKAAPVP